MPSDRRTATWVELLYAAGSLAQDQGDVATAWERGQESLALARELADYSGASGALNLLANVATVRGEYAAARAMHEEGIRAGRAALEEPRDGVQMPRGRSIVLLELTHVWGLAISAFHQGDDAEARARAEETRSRASKEGLTRPLAIALWILGMVDLRHGRLAAARTLLRQSLELCNAVGERGSARMVVLFALASVERDQGNLVQARELLLDSLAISAGVGGLPWIASCFEAFAGLAAACRQPERALRLAGAAEQLYAANPINAARVYRYGLDQWLGRARRALGTAGAEKALVEGRALNRAAAVAEAIAVQVPAVSGTSPPKPRWDLHGRMAGGWPEQRK
jgi:tetratricopeptide (TPR) repeat protein